MDKFTESECVYMYNTKTDIIIDLVQVASTPAASDASSDL